MTLPASPALLDALNAAGALALGLAGLWAWRRRPHDPAARALLAVTTAGAVALAAAVDGAAPWLGVAGELAMALLPAALLHLALTFPNGRRGTPHGALVPSLYLPCLTLAFVSLVARSDPTVYGLARNLVRLGGGGAALMLVACLAATVLRTPSPPARRRAALALLGALAATLPAALLLASEGAAAARAAAATTAFFFPLAVGTALAGPGAIEIDDLLRRVATAALLTATVAAAYSAPWLVFGTLDLGDAWLAASTASVALLNLAAVFLVAATRARVRALIDRLLPASTYDSDTCLADLSRGLAAARTVETVSIHARDVLGRALCPSWAHVYVADGEGRFRLAGSPGRSPLTLPPALRLPLDRGEAIVVEDDALRDDLPAPWNALATGLLAPLRAGGTLVGLLVLGRRTSQRPYTASDLAFLRTAAYPIALALLGSAAFEGLASINERLAGINAGLEAQVAERTAALQAKNSELSDSLAALQDAYRQLEERHVSLLRAERLATLGRLTAGLAHEINTPLSAVMNALKVVGDLGREYAAGIDDPETLPDDHRAIACELLATAAAAAAWAQKAASHLRDLQSHGREACNPKQPFALREVVDEARRLLTHRLRGVDCRIEFSEEPHGLMLIGDRGQLGQILVNIISNAIDAYEQHGITRGRVAIHAAPAPHGGRRLHITDWAGGIPPAILPHIFEELYTSKARGHGTGLGLWMARSLLERSFGGTLDVLTSNGSSCFVADLPPTACMPASGEPVPLQPDAGAAAHAAN